MQPRPCTKHERSQSQYLHNGDEGVTELQPIEDMKLAAKHKCRWPERACQSQRPLRMCVRVAQGGVVDGGGEYLRSVAQTARWRSATKAASLTVISALFALPQT